MRHYFFLFLIYCAASFSAPTLISADGADVHLGQHTLVEADRHESNMVWSDFSIGKDESIHFALPSPHSVAVNKIEGGISKISGKFTSNGHVHLLNQAGIVFMPSSQVDVAVLYARGSMVELGGQLNASYVRVEAEPAPVVNNMQSIGSFSSISVVDNVISIE